ncbi:MAG: nuclear transport factor 2 family protein [Pyrinomonadaceae bacterium]
MKRIILVILLTTCGAAVCAAQTRKTRGESGGESVEDRLVSYERRSWESVKRKDYKTFESFLAEDFYDIFPDGQVVTKTELMRDYIRGVELVDYSLSRFKVVRLNRDAAIVVYETVARGTENHATSRNTEKGREISIHAAVTSAWARRGGRWLNVFYRENDIK